MDVSGCFEVLSKPRAGFRVLSFELPCTFQTTFEEACGLRYVYIWILSGHARLTGTSRASANLSPPSLNPRRHFEAAPNFQRFAFFVLKSVHRRLQYSRRAHLELLRATCPTPSNFQIAFEVLKPPSSFPQSDSSHVRTVDRVRNALQSIFEPRRSCFELVMCSTSPFELLGYESKPLKTSCHVFIALL